MSPIFLQFRKTYASLPFPVLWTWMIIATVFMFIIPLVLLIVLTYKSADIVKVQSLYHILFSEGWAPESGHFGLLPFIFGSISVTVVAVVLAAPVCVFSAIHLTQFGHPKFLAFMRPVIDILAALPSVVYGTWGVVVIVPLISQKVAPFFGMSSPGYSLLAGSLVLAIMIIPIILNILLEVFRCIPQELTESALSMGATRWQVVKKVILRKAYPGIFSAVTLGVSRAFGETIAVLMVIGNVVKIPDSLFQPAYPLPSLIANNFGEMLSIPLYDSALMFSALILFVIVMFFNLLSRMIIIYFEKKVR